MQSVSFYVRTARVEGYLHTDHNRLAAHKVRPAMIVCPGGGYEHLSPREGETPAFEFFAKGYNVFVLYYSVRERARNLMPLKELVGTVEYVRRNAGQWNIAPDKIAVMGFSAGGHLAATLGAHWHKLNENCRPNALVLCYPVISMGEFAHKGTRDNVTGGRPDLMDKLSIENHVTANFPPCFIWHTVDDESVPVENSLMLISALRREKVPFESHFFAYGVHGCSTCTQEVETLNPEVRPWVELSSVWLGNLFDFTV